MANESDAKSPENPGTGTLPNRMQRLRALVKLRYQRRDLLVASAALAVLCALLLYMTISAERRAADAVPLGRGVAGIEKPVVSDPIGEGEASYYGRKFAGRQTASGERFDPERRTAAHRTLPLGSRVRVTNTRNGESVVVRVNDRGPFHPRRVIDLSKGAARQIGMLESGTARVRLALLL